LLFLKTTFNYFNMIITVSRTEAINQQLETQGLITYLNEPKHIEAIVAMNDDMAEVRRDYQVKDHNSQNSAATVVLTT